MKNAAPISYYAPGPSLKAKTLAPSDFSLLSELEEDARQPLAALAKKLKISQQLLFYRLQSLRKKNIVAGYFTRINFTAFGYTRYRVMVRLSNYSPQKAAEIITALKVHPNVQWLVECGGRWDLIINFMAKNIIQLEGFLKELKGRFPRQMQNLDVLTTIEVIELGRSYFTGGTKEVKNLSYFGRDYDGVKIDRINLLILSFISENARRSSVEIAEKLGVSPNTVSMRIKNLKARGIIRGFKPLIHLENLGYGTYKTAIKFQNHTERREREIIDFLRKNIQVVAIIRLIGQWDFEIEFEVDSRRDVIELTRNFRDKFKDVIKEFEIIPLYHEYRYNFFPGDLLS